MDRRLLHIFMALVLALQASLVGMAVCSDGGCCHVDDAALHADSHDDDDHNDHSSLVNADDPHPCNCTDQEIAGDDAITGLRDELPAAGPTFDIVLVWATSEFNSWPRAAVRAQPWQRRGDPAALQRMAIIRTTRLQI